MEEKFTSYSEELRAVENAEGAENAGEYFTLNLDEFKTSGKIEEVSNKAKRSNKISEQEKELINKISRFGSRFKAETVEDYMLFAEKVGSAELAYKIARQTRFADVKRMQKVVVNSGNRNYAYQFAKDIEGADVKLLGKIATSGTKTGENAYKFARDVKKADVKALSEVVYSLKDAKYAYLFAQDFKGVDKKLMEQTVIKAKNAKYAFEFIKNIKGANAEALADVIRKSKDTKTQKEFQAYLFQKINKLKGRSKKAAKTSTQNQEVAELQQQM